MVSSFVCRYLVPKGTAVPVQAYYRPVGFQEVEAPRFLDSRHVKVVGLSILRTDRLYSTGKYSWYTFLLVAESTLGP